MNQMWVRISLTYIAIAVFLFLIPMAVYISIHSEDISSLANNGIQSGETLEKIQPGYISRFVTYTRLDIAVGVLRILFSISLVGILVGVISSRGLAAPLRNLAEAAKAVGSQDLSQRIEVKGTDEIREVALSFNAMAEALEEADRLRNNMLADIAHELRTPLTVIQGNLRAILDDVYELDKVEVARLYDQTRQLSRLVDDLHDLALLEAKAFSLDLDSLNLISVIQDVAAIYLPIFEDQNIALTLDLPETIPAVEGDCARITQCINNLLNNALRHTPSGGEVAIKLFSDDHMVNLSVKDSGVGISDDHLPYVFDRFYRVDPDRNRRTGGSGLGLAISYALVLAHGGTIHASSPGKDQGSEFLIQIPVIDQE
jgi:signal transduction histidine kinase